MSSKVLPNYLSSTNIVAMLSFNFVSYLISNSPSSFFPFLNNVHNKMANFPINKPPTSTKKTHGNVLAKIVYARTFRFAPL